MPHRRLGVTSHKAGDGRERVMISDFFTNGILVLLVVLIAVPVTVAIARTVQQHMGRRR